jgi:serine/threonine protein kinase
MKCPKCQSDNPDTSRFCGNCATQLKPAGQPVRAVTKTLESPAYVLAEGTLVAGKYRLLDEIGRGGMGVVYKAEDTKLGRQVAIKVLPEAFTADPERLARFEREARVLASLNHPNIAAIYGVEEAEGKRFLVLELVEGESLAERLSRGRLTIEDTLEVCRQVAVGLKGAHERGIIHRDLKPSNVTITPEGKVKILDFGLAKAFHEQVSEADINKSPTITADMTRPGVILGTAAYMSPEQARGKAVDKRADIWAFGCILFECLAGKRAFPGDTATESIAAMLKGEPDWRLLPVNLPANVRAVLGRCLQKDRNLRYHDIADAWVELEAPAGYPQETTPSRRRFSALSIAAYGAIMLIAGLFIDRVLARYLKPGSSPSVVTSIIKVEPGHWLDGMRRALLLQRPSRTALAMSGDGRFVVYSAIEENPGPQARPRLYLRRMDQPEASPIEGTDGGINPFLSPDDRWVGFWADGKLKKVPIAGGIATTLCDAASLFGASWSRDNSIVFAGGATLGLSLVSANGGKPETLTSPDPKREEISHRLPFWHRNGKVVLFTVMRHVWDYQPWLAVLRLDTREWRVLLEDAADARYLPTGHLAFMRQGTLMAVAFDASRLKVMGQPFPLVENVMQTFSTSSAHNTGAGQFSISETGSLIYAWGGIVPDQNDSLVWVGRNGNAEPVMDLELPFFAPRLSPDGQRIAYGIAGREWQIWVYDLSRGTNSRLTGEGRAAFPVWLPDCRRLVFAWQKSLDGNLFWQPYDGSLPMDRLTTSEYAQYPGSWSPDGNEAVFVELHPGNGWDIELLDFRSGRMMPLLNSRFNETYPELSPDCRWLAYASDESNTDEVYVRPFPGPGMKFQISSGGGNQPLWARNGKQLFYRWLDRVWVVDVQTEGGFATSKPRLVFEQPGYASGNPIRNYDLSLDGQKFLMVKSEPRKATPVTEMTLIQDWFEELKRLVPMGKR